MGNRPSYTPPVQQYFYVADTTVTKTDMPRSQGTPGLWGAHYKEEQASSSQNTWGLYVQLQSKVHIHSHAPPHTHTPNLVAETKASKAEIQSFGGWMWHRRHSLVWTCNIYTVEPPCRRRGQDKGQRIKHFFSYSTLKIKKQTRIKLFLLLKRKL